nr:MULTISPECIES: arsenate reductase (glutaredoxin) [unclassified Rhizobium]
MPPACSRASSITKGIFMSVTIYHNDRSTTSLAVVEIVRAAGIEPVIIEYMKTPPSHEAMLALLLAMDMTPRALLRTRERAYLSLQLDDEGKTDRQIIDAMLAHPELIERPIVVTEMGVKVCRPKTKVLELL